MGIIASLDCCEECLQYILALCLIQFSEYKCCLSLLLLWLWLLLLLLLLLPQSAQLCDFLHWYMAHVHGGLWIFLLLDECNVRREWQRHWVKWLGNNIANELDLSIQWEKKILNLPNCINIALLHRLLFQSNDFWRWHFHYFLLDTYHNY